MPNAPDLGFGASLLQECASKQMPAEEEVAALGGEEEPESGETDDVTEDAEAGPTNDEETVVDRDESDASPHQGEEEPQQLSQVGSGLPCDSE